MELKEAADYRICSLTELGGTFRIREWMGRSDTARGLLFSGLYE